MLSCTGVIVSMNIAQVVLSPNQTHHPQSIHTGIMILFTFHITSIEKALLLLINLFKHPSSALTLLVERQEVHPTCKKTGRWFVDGDNLAFFHVL